MTTAKRASKATAARGIEEILAAARPREAEVSLCLAGDLAADADRLAAEIDRIGSVPRTSLADVDPRTALVAELEKVHAKMRANSAVFRFRALSRKDYSDLLAAHQSRDATKEAWNLDTFPPALIAASCIEPAMTVEQAEDLFSRINQNGRDLLWSAAWRANTGEVRVPFSLAASPSPSS